ncbi:MAG: septum formation initiator family protein [Chloroflexi bacterium]|nr:septum formation initiator family protein [Chloroflexota bacterium]
MGALRNNQFEQERAQTARGVAELQQKEAYLKAVKDYVSSDAYVEQEARRQLGYVRDGEVGFAVISPPAAPDPTAPTGDWWQRLFPR